MKKLKVEQIDDKTIRIEDATRQSSKVFAARFEAQGNESQGLVKLANDAERIVYLTHFSEIEVNGASFGSVAETVTELNRFVGNFKSGGSASGPGGITNGDLANAIKKHDISTAAHDDIRKAIAGLSSGQFDAGPSDNIARVVMNGKLVEPDPLCEEKKYAVDLNFLDSFAAFNVDLPIEAYTADENDNMIIRPSAKIVGTIKIQGLNEFAFEAANSATLSFYQRAAFIAPYVDANGTDTFMEFAVNLDFNYIPGIQDGSLLLALGDAMTDIESLSASLIYNTVTDCGQSFIQKAKLDPMIKIAPEYDSFLYTISDGKTHFFDASDTPLQNLSARYPGTGSSNIYHIAGRQVYASDIYRIFIGESYNSKDIVSLPDYFLAFLENADSVVIAGLNNVVLAGNHVLDLNTVTNPPTVNRIGAELYLSGLINLKYVGTDFCGRAKMEQYYIGKKDWSKVVFGANAFSGVNNVSSSSVTADSQAIGNAFKAKFPAIFSNWYVNVLPGFSMTDVYSVTEVGHIDRNLRLIHRGDNYGNKNIEVVYMDYDSATGGSNLFHDNIAYLSDLNRPVVAEGLLINANDQVQAKKDYLTLTVSKASSGAYAPIAFDLYLTVGDVFYAFNSVTTSGGSFNHVKVISYNYMNASGIIENLDLDYADGLYIKGIILDRVSFKVYNISIISLKNPSYARIEIS